ncbi:MAG: ATP-binding cassette domain-containing protein, partial [Allorhizobium sp.]
IIADPLRALRPELNKDERRARVVKIMEAVGLLPEMINRYPHEFSGGQRHRSALARSMILKPKVVILDEPTSALDRSVQRQVIELLRDLQDKHGLSYVFISHDLSVIRAMSDHVIVMKNGKIVEQGATETIFDHPQEDYTRDLIAAAFSH